MFKQFRHAVAPLLICSAFVGAAFAQGKAPAVGQAAPAIKAATLGGGEVNLAEGFKGKLVLVDFWATWCPPCRKEIPHLVEAYEKFHGDGLEIIGVSLDKPRKISAEKVTAFTQDNKMAWAQVYENVEDLAAKYGIETIPAAFLVNGDTGKVVAAGPDLRGDALAKTLEKHLKKKAGGPKKP